MSDSLDGDVARGADFVNDFGVGPAGRGHVAPNYGAMGLAAPAAIKTLADVVALAELLLERLAEATGVHERQILFALIHGLDESDLG